MVKLADGGCDLLPWTAKHCCPMDWVYCSSNCRVPNDLGGYDPPANGNVFWDDGARVTLRDDAMDVSAFEDLLMCPSPANDAAEHSRGQQQKNALRRQAKAAVISKRRDISTTAKPTAPKSAPRTAPPPRAWSRPDVTVDDEYGDADDWDEDVSEESEDEDDASAPAGRPARPSRASSQLDADVRRKSMPTVDWATMYSALADAACGAAASSVDWTIADAVLYAGGDLDEAALEAVRAHIEREAHREEKRYDDGVAYTRLEFSEYYGDDSAWLAAPRGMPLQSAPTADRAPAAREASDLARALALSQDDGALDDDDALHDALRASLRASDADADAIGRALALSRLPGGSATATFAPVGESPWGCGACTFANAAAAPECGMCGTARLSEAPTWICGECTFANAEKPSGVSLCDMCGSARQARPAPLPKRPARAAPPPYAAATQRPRPPLAAETPGWPRGAQFQPLVYDDDDDDLVAGGGPTARR
ncbi:hypothetical protein M885DRAFT_537696 [Pelagophyceae sp. CCMP2097]|nr:hypothetical protein M885DRAFT_537696 [Pelagophyceae sp. CCMP2097]